MAEWQSQENEGCVPHSELLSDCRILFGPEVVVDRDFLWYLQPEGAKSAYRRRARESHPDAHPDACSEQMRQLQQQFVQVADAYRRLSSFLVQRPGPSPLITDASVRQNGQGVAATAGGTANCEWSTPYERLYGGQVPMIRLRIGRYLYFRGVVSFQAVLEALAWQRAQRPALGALARSWGWLDDDDVQCIVRTTAVRGRFGERAVQLGLLAPWQCRELLQGQRLRQERLGRFFVMRHGLDERTLLQLELERLQHNQRLGVE